MTAVRALVLTTALAAVLAGCNRDREPAPAEAPAPGSTAAVTPADAAAPMNFVSETPWADVRLNLPDAIKPQTDLHARLYAEEVRKLRQFTEGAQGELTEAGADADQPKFEKTITITAAAETGKLLSLKRVDFDYAGGANPNTLTSGLLWDKALKRRVTMAQLFRPGADLTALDQALCSAINAAKRARVPDGPSITLGGSGFACPRAADTAFVLTPGTVPGKAAGLTFLINPYQVGPRSEGAYEIALPLTAFRALLATAYADEFGGQLVKAGDVTPVAAGAA
ncbi:MAG: RsiV family protein [Brevundimonas sp.]